MQVFFQNYLKIVSMVLNRHSGGVYLKESMLPSAMQ